MKHHRILLFTFLVSIFSQLAWANMSVDRAIVVFEPNQSPRADVEISNEGNEVLYIQVEVFQIKNPGTGQEERIKITNPDDIGLLVTPNKLIVPPNGHKLVRLVSLKPADDQERVYRIKFTPMVGEFQANSNGVKVVIAYGVLVIVQPQDPDPSLQVTRTGNKLLVKNNGNTNALFQDGTQCPENNDNGCEQIKSKRIYAGSEWEIDLPLDQGVDFYVTVGSETTKKSYP